MYSITGGAIGIDICQEAVKLLVVPLEERFDNSAISIAQHLCSEGTGVHLQVLATQMASFHFVCCTTSPIGEDSTART